MKKYWDMIYNEMKKLFKYTFPKKPEAFLLGKTGDELKKKDCKLFMYATTAARILLSQKWKSQEIPTLMEWQTKMFDSIDLVKLTYKIRNQKEAKFEKDWNKFVEYIRSNCKNLKTVAGLM
ncbi:Hypothetical predicted protein [Podarcis lilfordi]|uniref:Uncharacterized protein n=1 Tax=Podarcis lilfordi TaxID=74358 RepID=A0AA35PQF6_9SAUR|nr:Hypothetical predicted protein [Podarcis lilfordi]